MTARDEEAATTPVQALTESELAFVRSVLDALPDHIYVKDLQGRYLLVNAAGLRERTLQGPDDIIGKTAFDLVPREAAERMSAEDRRVVESGRPLINREAMTAFAGVAGDKAAPRWHITTKIPMRDANGAVIGVLGVNRDITDRKRAELALRDSEETFRALFDQAAVGITVVSLSLRYLRVNDKFCEMVGYSRAELLSMMVTDLVPPQARDQVLDYRAQILAGTAHQHDVREREFVHKDGRRVWVGLATSLVTDASGAPAYFANVVQDISESKRAATALRESEERFRHLAHHDALTGLPNRALFHDRLRHALHQSGRNRWTLGVLLIDLDRFKQVNDTLGHAAGDELLKAVATRLGASIRSADTAARLGGDEFAVILHMLTNPPDADIVARKVIGALTQPFAIQGRQVSVGASVGIAIYPDDAADAQALLKRADVAMYEAKSAGGCGYSRAAG